MTPTAATVVEVVGAACDRMHPCGGTLTCGGGPGGYCTRACSEACGSARCVESPTARTCRATCTSNADCRDGYACDPQWSACMVPNSSAIAVKDCGAPVGFGRDPAFGPTTSIGAGREPTAAIAEDGTLIVMVAGAMSRIDLRGEVTTRPVPLGAHPWLASNGLYAIAMQDRRVAWMKVSGTPALVDVDCVGCASRPMTLGGADPLRKGAELVYVSYAAGDGLRVRVSADGGATFGPARSALAGTYGQLAVDREGGLYAVAVRGGAGVYGSGDNRIDFTMSADGGKSFAKPRMLNISGERIPYYFANPSVVVDSARKWIYVAYARGGRDAKWDIALLASNDKGKTWKRTRIGDEACAIHMVPNLALDPTTGQVHVAWYDSRGLRFAHAMCTSGLGACRQLGRINDQPFAALSTMRAGELALGDHQALVVDNARRILHAVWTQPVDDGGKVTARIFHAKAKLPLR